MPVARFQSETALCLYLATAIGYAVSYEWLHFSYHLPHEHPVAQNPIIQRLARHLPSITTRASGRAGT